MIADSKRSYGRDATNRIEQARDPGIEGARALLETFYFAFNQRDVVTFKDVWADHSLIQLNNPLGGILRGYAPIAALYQRIFSGPARVWVELYDIVEFQSGDMVVFAGRETGAFEMHGKALALTIRTSRVVQWLGSSVGWRQVHHHGSIDDPRLLTEYRTAIESTK